VLYWHIGQRISDAEQTRGWGAKVVARLGADLRSEFPTMTGFSLRNLRYMRDFAEAWPDESMLQQAAAKLPWGHVMVLLDKVKAPFHRDWYARKATEHGWSRAILEVQIETRLHEREGKALTNFASTLPPRQSDFAQQLFKDPYNFDFLTLSTEAKERDLEQGLMNHVQKTLLELGEGFALVGRQVRIEVGGESFSIDLLFYHLDLHCFIVVDLKARAFQPEFAGKLNFYLSAIDDQLRRPGDRKTIGLLLAKNHNGPVVECALRDIAKPIGVATWTSRIIETLPEELREALPSSGEQEAP